MPYSFVIANEDFVTYRNIKVNFLSDKSAIESTDQSTEYSLLPGENDKLETRIKCKYRGEYYVGVESIVVKDFLYLFSLTYPIGSKLKAVVLPRVVPLESLGITPLQMDVKNPIHYTNAVEEELDTEIRRYVPGDTRKRIHWKASAKKNELMSRKYLSKPKAAIVMYMDLTRMEEDDLQVIIMEDKIIECVLAIANFYSQRRIPVHLTYDMGGRKQVIISSKDDFKVFYNSCISIRFHASAPVSQLVQERLAHGEQGMYYLIATHYLRKELYLTTQLAISRGNQVNILFISNDVSEKTKDIISSMRLAGADVYQIMAGEEIEEILSMEKI